MQGVTELGREASIPEAPLLRDFYGAAEFGTQELPSVDRARSSEIQAVPIAASSAEEPLEGTGGCHHFSVRALGEQGPLPEHAAIAPNWETLEQHDFKDRRGLQRSLACEMGTEPLKIRVRKFKLFLQTRTYYRRTSLDRTRVILDLLRNHSLSST